MREGVQCEEAKRARGLTGTLHLCGKKQIRIAQGLEQNLGLLYCTYLLHCDSASKWFLLTARAEWNVSECVPFRLLPLITDNVSETRIRVAQLQSAVQKNI